jgi:hypothetical protein
VFLVNPGFDIAFNGPLTEDEGEKPTQQRGRQEKAD